jgi:hypothetical protein
MSGCAGVLRRRAGAVEQDARPNPVGARFGEAQQRSRIGHRHRAVEALRQRNEARQLRRDTAFAIGVGKMGHQADRARVRPGTQAGQCRNGAIRRDAEPVHARIDLEKQRDARRRRQRRRFEPVQLFHRVHHHRQAVGGDLRQILRAEEPFQQQDGLADACLAQSHGVFQVQQCESVGHAAQPARDAHDAVAVRVGLDHGPDLRATCELATQLMVVAQRIEIDARMNRAKQREGSGKRWTRHERGEESSGVKAAGCRARIVLSAPGRSPRP